MWSIQEAERLLLSLPGVVSARVVAVPGGRVEEVHLVTTAEIKPKSTVRNAKTALLAQLELDVDHRKISVAQSTDPVPERRVPEPVIPIQIVPDPEPQPHQSRLLFYSHHVESERSNQVKHRVEVEWLGERYTGEATAADLPKPKLEAVSIATLNAVEKALTDKLPDGRRAITLSLDGVKIIEAFERRYAIVAVHAIHGRDVSRLAGTTVADEASDRAAILATLQATDRWVRGHYIQ